MSDHTDSPQYRTIAAHSVDRALDRKPQPVRQQLAAAMRALAADPRPHGCAPVVTRPGVYRVRVGDWRILYAVDDDQQLVTVLEIMSRQDDYRRR